MKASVESVHHLKWLFLQKTWFNFSIHFKMYFLKLENVDYIDCKWIDKNDERCVLKMNQKGDGDDRNTSSMLNVWEHSVTLVQQNHYATKKYIQMNEPY